MHAILLRGIWPTWPTWALQGPHFWDESYYPRRSPRRAEAEYDGSFQV
jgi:hypothetical protein